MHILVTDAGGEAHINTGAKELFLQRSSRPISFVEKEAQNHASAALPQYPEYVHKDFIEARGPVTEPTCEMFNELGCLLTCTVVQCVPEPSGKKSGLETRSQIQRSLSTAALRFEESWGLFLQGAPTTADLVLTYLDSYQQLPALRDFQASKMPCSQALGLKCSWWSGRCLGTKLCYPAEMCFVHKGCAVGLRGNSGQDWHDIKSMCTRLPAAALGDLAESPCSHVHPGRGFMYSVEFAGQKLNLGFGSMVRCVQRCLPNLYICAAYSYPSTNIFRLLCATCTCKATPAQILH